MQMRRKDREITDNLKINAIISACTCMRLGFTDGEEAYIVPMNFGFRADGEKRCFYFHSAKEGRKVALIKRAGKVSFELDTGHELISGETACQYGYRFQSVMGTGHIRILEEPDEKREALSCLMEQYTKRADWSVPDAMLQSVLVFVLEAETISCKEHE